MADTFDEIIAGFGEESPNPLIDQEMLDVIDHARDVEWQLNMSTPSPDDIKKQVMVLDAEWDKWLNSTIEASGTVYCAPKNNERIAPVLEGVAVISKGFDVLIIEGDDDTLQYRVVHAFLVHPSDVLSSEELADSIFAAYEPEDMSYVAAYGLLDEIAIESNDMSTAKALDYITTFYPELEAEIDRRIVGARNSQEALLALRGLDIARFANCNNEITRYAVITYINALITIDHDCSLKLIFGEGSIYASTTDAGEMSLPVGVKGGDTLYGFVPSLIHFTEMHTYEDEPSNDWTLSFDVYSVTEDHREARRTFCIPIDTLRDIQSTRNMLK